MPSTNVTSADTPTAYDGVERELNEDAAWKRIQENTFTRWANEHLKRVQSRIGNLSTDLSDGLMLIRLIEVLSHKRLGKYNTKPNLRAQKLENVSMALTFLETVEGVKFVNIDSSAIVDSHLKLILGLIWTLILHYSISLPIYDEPKAEEDKEAEAKQNGTKATPKQKLMGWIQDKIPDMGVKNFTGDWKDGRALGALVDAVAPGLCADWEEWKPNDALENTAQTMDKADQWLGVPKLIEPQEFINPEVDERSMMTYLSQYPHAKLRTGAPLMPWTERSNIFAHGPGLQSSELIAGQRTEFYVDLSNAEGGDQLDVVVKHVESGKQEPYDVQYSSASKRFFVDYTPHSPGTYSVRIAYAGREVPKSPFNVLVTDGKKELNRIYASGPGLEPGVRAGTRTNFDIHTQGARDAPVEIAILDPRGNEDTVELSLQQVPDGYRCNYVALKPGLHEVNVFYDRQAIPGSPFTVQVSPGVNTSAVRAVGRGLQPKGVRVSDLADFYVNTENAGEGGLIDVAVSGPGGAQVPVAESNQVNPTKRYYAYQPVQPGQHTVSISYDGIPIAQSPFTVQVSPSSASKIRAYGPGLEGGIVDSPCVFTVETNGETGSLGFSIEGPAKAEINCVDNEDGSAEISFLPTVPGDYAVHILCNDEDIPNSPFIANVVPFEESVRPNLVHCYGPGLQSNGVVKDQVAEFVVDASKAGPGMTKIWAIDRNYDFVDIKVDDLGNQVYSCSYVPLQSTRHTIVVSHAGVGVPGSPYRVLVQEASDPSKVSVYGPGVESGVKSQHPTHFVVDCKRAGAGEIEVALSDDTGSKVDIDVLENTDGTFTVKYTAPRPGTYQIRVVFAGAEIPGSPIRVNVQPHLDLGGVRVEGLDDTVFVDSLANFVVDFQSPDRLEETKPEHLQCVLTTPSQKMLHSIVKRIQPDVYSVSYVPQEEGTYVLDLTYDSIPLHQFPIAALKGNDPSRCKAHGDGLQRGYVGFPCEFVVETKGAGPGQVHVVIEGPSQATIDSRADDDGARRIEYITSEPGDYSLSIKFADVNIPGSPFRVTVDYPVDASKVSAWGPGLEQNNVRANTPLQFHVDASKSGFAPLNVVVSSNGNRQVSPLPEIRERTDNTYDITYYPSDAGTTCSVHVTYGGTDIPNSPYQMRVLPTAEPDKVRLITGEDVVPLGEIPASLPYTFTIDTRNAGFANLEVSVVDPDKRPCPVDVVDKGDGVYDVTLVPEDTGLYNVVIKYGGEEIDASPYHVVAQPVGDASKCFISDGFREQAAVNEEYTITVNAVNAGNVGTVNCRILPLTTGPQSYSVKVEDNKDGTFSVHYTLKGYGTYTISIKFGGQPIPGGVWNISAVSPEELKSPEYPVIHTLRYEGEYTDSVTSLQPVQLLLPGNLLQDLSVQVKSPSNKVGQGSLRDNGDGTFSVRYSPKETGLHEMQIKQGTEHVQGSPLQFFVYDLDDAAVTAYGQGLMYGTVGRESNFTVQVKDKIPAGMAVYIEGPSKADIKCRDNYDGTCTVGWLPMASGVYKVHVKYDDKEIDGSPFTAKVTENLNQSSHITVGSPSEVSLEIPEARNGHLTASMTSPTGGDVPCTIRPLDEGHLSLSFTPRETGEYLANVKRDNTPLASSPYRIYVNEGDIGKPDKIKLQGLGLSEAITQQFNEFTVDTREAGSGSLVISIEGPSKCEIDCVNNKDGTSTVMYRPTEPGVYVVSVNFAGRHVKGSPFTVKCQGVGLGTVSEQVQQMRTAAHQATPGNPCELCIKIPGTDVGNLSGSLMSPNGKVEDVEVVDLGDHLYIVRFVPREVGLHTVSVLHKGQHISGSPFLFTVGTFEDGGGAHKVRAAGVGLHQGVVNYPQTFNIYTREAGPGNLSVTIEGPSKAKIDFKDHKDDNCYITYSVSRPGDYKIAIKFDEVHIPDSPFNAHVTATSDEASKMEVASLPTNILPVNKSAAVTVLTHGAKGYLDAKITSPSGVTDDCFITPSPDGGSYFVTFVPQELGYHHIHLKLDGFPLASSPVRVSVVDHEQTDTNFQPAELMGVRCEGSGLVKAHIGRKNAFSVYCSDPDDSRRLLFVAVMTPSGPSDDIYIKYMGNGNYEVDYSVHEHGTCYIHVKYGNEDVPGSPFPVVV